MKKYPQFLTAARITLFGIFAQSSLLHADYAAEVLSENPLVYYRFDDGSSNAAIIANNSGSVGALGNAPLTNNASNLPGAMPGNTNKAITSSLKSLSIPYQTGLNNAGSFTVEAWVKPSAAVAPGAAHVLSSCDFVSPRSGWILMQSTASGQGFIFRTYNKRTTNVAININTATNLTAGTWYHVVCTYNDATRQGKIYLNGVLKNTATVSTAGADGKYYEPPPATIPLTFHVRSDDTGPFSGGLDEIAYYPTTLSDAQILDHYNNGINPTPATSYDALVLSHSPAGYWRLNETTYTVPTAANLGTLGGAANGTYNLQAYNTDTGPKTSSGFTGFGTSNNALSLTAQNGHVGVPLPLLNDRSAFTVTGWVKRGAVKSIRGGYFGQNDLLEFGDATSGTNIEAWSAANGGNILTPYSFADDQWGFIALTANAGVTTLYLNGVQVGQMNATVANYGSSGFNFNIGGGGVFNGTGDYFRGEIDEVAVFNKALAANRVKQLYDAALGNVAPVAATPLVSPSTTIMEGSSYTLSIVPSGSPPFTYQWKVDGSLISGANSATLTINPAVLQSPVGSPFVYTCEVTNAIGSDESDPLEVVIARNLVWDGTAASDPTLWDVADTANWKPLAGGAAITYTNNSTVLFNDNATGTNIFIPADVEPINVTFDNSSKNFTFVASNFGISGSASITKNGTGSVTMLTNNFNTGATTINAGMLAVGDGSNGVIDGTATMTINGGILRINDVADAPYTNPTLIAASGTLEFKGTGPMILNGASSITGTGTEIFDRDGLVTINKANQISQVQILRGEVLIDGSQVLNRLGDAAQVTVAAGATMTIAGVNPIPTIGNAARITLNGGTLKIITGGSNAIGNNGESHAHLHTLTLNGATVECAYSGTGTAYSGESVQIFQAINVTGASASSIITGVGATNDNSGVAFESMGSMNVANATGDAQPDLIIDAELENNGDGSPDGFNKTGAGTILLAGGRNHSMNGTVTIAAGTLLGTGSLPATLVISAAATISPDASTNTFAVGSTNIQGTYTCDINDTAADRLQITGNLSLPTGSIIEIQALNPTQPAYVIAEYTGTLTRGTNVVNGIPNGYIINYAYGPTMKQIALVSTAASPYTTWASNAGLTVANNGMLQDPDQDGLSNLMEFVLSGLPLTSSQSPLPTAQISNSDMIFTFKRSDASESAGVLVFEHSSDLTTWTEITIGAASSGNVTIVENAAADDDVTITLPRASQAKRFGRLKQTAN